jgi:hypothetical protein
MKKSLMSTQLLNLWEKETHKCNRLLQLTELARVVPRPSMLMSFREFLSPQAMSSHSLLGQSSVELGEDLGTHNLVSLEPPPEVHLDQAQATTDLWPQLPISTRVQKIPSMFTNLDKA